MSNYVGLVLISHSYDLAYGLKTIASQVEPDVPIAIAGGSDDNEIGTSVIKIKEAVESVYSDKGVILFFDLGSALMNAELAVEFLGHPLNVKIADAPLVEGVYAAAVESGCGGDLDEVLKVAEQTRSLEKKL
jgi:PTS hybrid protein